MKIIPAIDIMNGQCVRLTQGDFGRKTSYSVSPEDRAHELYQAGFRDLHVVDLDAARTGVLSNIEMLPVMARIGLAIDFGGGIRDVASAKRVLSTGVSAITLGSVLIKDTEAARGLLATIPSDQLIIGADVQDGMIAVSGWTETSSMDVFSFLSEKRFSSVRTVICTDITQDGTLAGANVDLYNDLQKAFPSKRFIASGGVGSLEDIEALRAIDCYGVIVGKALFEGKVQPNQLIEQC
ncbi:MAG: 1-(5-phosphoribosyl)-5-[(5-phosphoribosylamino)methylideneamino] imidazole-4-carboxamide isomerase [Flavobacteriales bacterium]|nr:1-(5-phosphoribosyl)-5-[(5-phosphoribosylamino)methylideneamino] imidazole-4-carboxamide isomerase [Flavobacteriales bacterium]